MSSLDVKRVDNKKMMKQFIMFPWTARIYENDPAWVPPVIMDMKNLFNPKKGYFFEIGEVEFFLAYRDNTPVGRITAHINRLYEEKYDTDTGFFGFFESINDVEVARMLFDAAEEWLHKKGKKVMQGPQSFSVYDSVGFEAEGADILPVVGLFHFAPYYKDLAEACGFKKCIDWYCFLVKKIDDYKPYLKDIRMEILDQMREKNIVFKLLDKRIMKEQAQDVKRIFNAAWDGNWGHLPLTDKQFKMFYGELSLIAIPELAILAEKDGETIGFIISLPDINPALRILNGRLYPWRLLKFLFKYKKTSKLRTIIMGVMPEHRGQKIDDVFYLMTIENGVNMGYNESDCSLIVETNKKMINALKPLKADRYKTYRIYERKIRS